MQQRARARQRDERAAGGARGQPRRRRVANIAFARTDKPLQTHYTGLGAGESHFTGISRG